MSSKRKEVYWSVDGSPSGSLGPLTNDTGNAKPQHQHHTQIKKKTSKRSTLKTLCPEDKHKVRQLIEDLAKTGAEKDAIEQLLKKERHDFDEKLSQLHLEQQNLVEERTRLERSLHDSELQLRAIKSQNDQLVQVKNVPVVHSASVGQWSHDHLATPTTAINLDHSLNYLLHSKGEPQGHLSSSTSSTSLFSSLHTADLTPLQQLPSKRSADNSVPHPPAEPHPPAKPHPSAAHTDTGVQTIKIAHTAVQTDIPVVPSVSSHHSMVTMTSSEFDNKMEHMMATALLNAKDTVNTIEALSQSLLMKSVSRESSLMTLQQPLTSTQCVPNNQAVTSVQCVPNNQAVTSIQCVPNDHAAASTQGVPNNQVVTSIQCVPNNQAVTSIQCVPNNQAVISTQCVPSNQVVTCTQCVPNNLAVANSQDVDNTPKMVPIQEPLDSHVNSNQMDVRTHVTPSGHTPRSHADHVITSSPQQHSYTLYDTGHHEDTSLYFDRDDELQLEDLAETLNSSTLPMDWLHSHYFSMGTNTCGIKNSNIAMATQPVGEHLLIDHSDTDVINDLFFLQ